MTIHTRPGRARRMGVLLVAAFVLATTVPVTVSAGKGATIVRGVQHEYGSCGNGTGYLMTGDLEGCWWIDTFNVKPMPVQGTLLARGTETFIGTLGGRHGTFRTTYTFTAKFDGATELHGRCHHPITEGTGVFAGARGVLNFTDVLDTDPVSYPYWGNIQLDREATTLTFAITPSVATAAEPGVATAPC